MPPPKLEDCFPVGCGRMYTVPPTHELPARDFPCDAEGFCPECSERLRRLSRLSLRQLLDLQVQYHHEHAIADGEEWLDHAHDHLAILNAKLARYFERKKGHKENPSLDEIRDEAIPDLLFWFFETMIALRLADPAKVFAQRITANIKRDAERAQADARAKEPPICMGCGIQMQRAGSIFACPSCGNTSEGF